MPQFFSYIESLRGGIILPGDKSISHRAAIFAAMADGRSVIENFSTGSDTTHTLECLAALGAEVHSTNDSLAIRGCGRGGFSKPVKPLDCGNSGTTARLLTGLCAAQPFETVLTGDESLSARPMNRVIEPLNEMGAKIRASEKGTLPVCIQGNPKLNALAYEMPVASAQVKSALLIAGLHNEKELCVIETKPARNHTELMLGLKSVSMQSKNHIYSSSDYYPKPFTMRIPGDISSAAFFIVAALMHQDSEIKLPKVSVNTSRTAFIDLLQIMGADIRMENAVNQGTELAADVICRSSGLRNIEIDADIIPSIIDEIPILSAAGAFAEGDFLIRGAAELRIKESDRIKALCNLYRNCGMYVEEYEDGFLLRGMPLSDDAPVFDSAGDHRIAMTAAVIASKLQKGGSVRGFDCASVSNPHFITQLNKLRNVRG